MLNVNTIKNGLVIDHIRAGAGWQIYQWLGLNKAPFTSCLIQNVPSEKSGKKKGRLQRVMADSGFRKNTG
jgi:aspartate carbamoyltransferase regulatory subunit